MQNSALQSNGTLELGLVVTDLRKSYPGIKGDRRDLYENLNFTVTKNERLAVLGRNGQGKSTLIKILGGVLPADSGSIEWRMTPSWPIGFGGGFQGSLTGYDNVRFLARLYERDYQHVLERVDDFAELGKALAQPVKQYSSGMRARLAFGLSLAIDFDCYLIDEVIAVGDARFAQKCQTELFNARDDRSFIMASHDITVVRQVCQRAIIIEGGIAKTFTDIDEALDIYSWLHVSSPAQNI